MLGAVAIDRVQDVLLPDGMGGQIQVEHLLLTGNGLLVIDVKAFEGTIFASERMAEWTVIGKKGRFTFPNPLGTLYDRVAALKQLVRDVPVTGLVLFGERADFSKGRPRDVLSPAELMERYARPEQADLERLLVAFAPHWERVKGATEPRAGRRRANGALAQPEQPLGVRRRRGRHLVHRSIHSRGHARQDMREELRLVAPAARLRHEVARHEVWRVCFEQQPLERNVRQRFAQFRAAALVAHPARHADVQIEVEIGRELLGPVREAMRHAAREAGALRREDLDEFGMCVALMQEHGLACLRRELELRGEGVPLIGAWREVPKEVEAALAHGDDGRVRQQGAQRVARVRVELGRVMRVHAGRREQRAGMRRTELGGLHAVRDRGAGHDQSPDAGSRRALEHRGAIGVEAVVCQIGADVD